MAQSQWDSTRMAEQLTRLCVEQLREKLLWASRCVLAIDTTYVTKSSKTMLGVQRGSEASQSGQKTTVIGHQWAIVGLLAQIGNQIRCFPLMSRLICGKLSLGHWQVWPNGEASAVSSIDIALTMIDQIADFIRFAPICVVADAYFAKAQVFNAIGEMKLVLVTRLRADAVGFDDPVYCGRGRPPLRGKKFKIAQLLNLLPKTEISVDIYGKRTIASVVVKTLWLRGVLKKVKVVVVEAVGKPILLVSTDIHLTAKEMVEIYGRRADASIVVESAAARFTLEVAIRDLKQSIGFADYQSTTSIAFFRFTPLCCTALSIGQLLIANSLSSEVPQPKPSSRCRYLPHSFNRLRVSLKRFVVGRILASQSTVEQPFGRLRACTERSRSGRLWTCLPFRKSPHQRRTAPNAKTT